jgi:hypothetical protein
LFLYSWLQLYMLFLDDIQAAHDKMVTCEFCAKPILQNNQREQSWVLFKH